MSRGERYFRFALARELGMTYRQLIQNVDSRELAEWRAFFTVERRLAEGAGKPAPQMDKPMRDKLVAEELKSFFRSRRKS